MELFWILGVLLIITIMFFKTPTGKGIIGEWVVHIVIGRAKVEKKKYVIHDLTFHDGSKSVQIDHIIVNQSGIHVIETKNYGGHIYGQSKDSQWTQVLSYGKVKHKFYSPLKQNKGHIYALKKVLEYQGDYFCHIVFTARATLKVKIDDCFIGYPLQLKKEINAIKKHKQNLSDIEQRALYDQLNMLKDKNTISRKMHVKGIHERRKAKEADSL